MDLVAASASDLEDIAALVNGAYRGSAGLAGWTSEAGYIEGERTDAQALRDDLRSRPDARLLILREPADGQLLACVWLEPAEAEVWYLGLLTVRPDLQDRRLGREVLDAAEAFAVVHGAHRVRLTVVNVRDSLIAWYGRRGYGLTGETRPFPYDDQRFGAPSRPDLAFVALEKAVSRARP